MDIKLVDIINSITSFQLIFFSIYIIKKGYNSLPNKILLAFFITEFAVIFNYLIVNIFLNYFNRNTNLYYTVLPFWFVWGPLIFLYIKSQVTKNFLFSYKSTFHFIPALLMTLLLISGFFHLDANQYTSNRIIWASSLMNLQVLLYNASSLLMLRKYQKELKNLSSSIENQELKWIKFILYGYIFACTITEIIFLTRNIEFISNDLKLLFTYSAFLIFFNALFYKAIINPYVFASVVESSKKGNLLTKSADIENYITQLENFILSEKPFLNPSLSLKELSDLTGISERIISQAINQGRNQNFFSYINSFRVKEAKELLLSENFKEKNMVGIAYESGFNSKSAFYDTFKKYVGMTPKKYREVHSNLVNSNL